MDKEGLRGLHDTPRATFSASSPPVCVLSRSVVSDSLWPHGLQPTRLFCPWDFPGKNTGVGCHFLQGIFPTQGWNPNFLNWQVDSLSLAPPGKSISSCLPPNYEHSPQCTKFVSIPHNFQQSAQVLTT